MGYSVIRPFQRALTALLPHPGNSKYAIPKRRFRASPINPGRNVLVFKGLNTFTDGTQIPTIVEQVSPGAVQMDIIYTGTINQGEGSHYLWGSQNNNTSMYQDQTGTMQFQKWTGTQPAFAGQVLPGDVHTIAFEWGNPGEEGRCYLDSQPPVTYTTGLTGAGNVMRIGVRGSSANSWDGAIANYKYWEGTSDRSTDPTIELAIDEGAGATEVINTGTSAGANPTFTITFGNYGGQWEVYSP
jgi:hypothetical protein